MRVIDRVINAFEEIVVALGLGVATVATFVEVVLRYGFSGSMGGGGEFAQMCIIWASMVGAALATRTGTHIGVDVLVRRLPPRWSKLVVLFGLAAGAAFTASVTGLGIELVQFSRGTGQTTMELLFPRWPLYLSVPVGMALMTYHLLQDIVRIWQTPADELMGHVEADAEAMAEADVEAAMPVEGTRA